MSWGELENRERAFGQLEQSLSGLQAQRQGAFGQLGQSLSGLQAHCYLQHGDGRSTATAHLAQQQGAFQLLAQQQLSRSLVESINKYSTLPKCSPCCSKCVSYKKVDGKHMCIPSDKGTKMYCLDERDSTKGSCGEYGEWFFEKKKNNLKLDIKFSV